jgi:hypothetical protein
MLDMYGLGDVARRPDGGAACRKGVRIVQLYYSKGDPWDAHADIMAHNDAFGFTMWPAGGAKPSRSRCMYMTFARPSCT